MNSGTQTDNYTHQTEHSGLAASLTAAPKQRHQTSVSINISTKVSVDESVSECMCSLGFNVYMFIPK